MFDRSLWITQMRLLEVTRDVRIFHIQNATCVTTVRSKDDVFVVCYDTLFRTAKADTVQASAPLLPSRVKRAARNIAPLVYLNHQAWADGSANIWLFDPMGSAQNTLVISRFLCILPNVFLQRYT